MCVFVCANALGAGIKHTEIYVTHALAGSLYILFLAKGNVTAGMHLFVAGTDRGAGMTGSFSPDIVTSNTLSVRDSAAIIYNNHQ